MPVAFVSKCLGHHEPGFTMRTYQSVLKDDLTSVSDAIEGAFANA